MITSKDDPRFADDPVLRRWVEVVNRIEAEKGVPYANMVQCITTIFMGMQIIRELVPDKNDAVADACESDVAECVKAMGEMILRMDGTFDELRGGVMADMAELVGLIHPEMKPPTGGLH